tara:strand:- start:517 stop:684 length:168 start_codon:yes stop_codon:yes gene_type:complete
MRLNGKNTLTPTKEEMVVPQSQKNNNPSITLRKFILLLFPNIYGKIQFNYKKVRM